MESAVLEKTALSPSPILDIPSQAVETTESAVKSIGGDILGSIESAGEAVGETVGETIGETAEVTGTVAQSVTEFEIPDWVWWSIISIIVIILSYYIWTYLLKPLLIDAETEIVKDIEAGASAIKKEAKEIGKDIREEIVRHTYCDLGMHMGRRVLVKVNDKDLCTKRVSLTEAEAKQD